MKTSKVVIIEDDAELCEILSVVVNGTSGFDCVGAFKSLEQALDNLPHNDVDLVLLDIHVAKASGLDFLRQVKSEFPGIGVIVATMDDSDDTVFSAFEIGADGFLTKPLSVQSVVNALEEWRDGGVPLSKSIANRILGFFRSRKNRVTDISKLTPREKEVFMELIEGLAYVQIGQKLGIAQGTLRVHVNSIYKKLGVKSRSEASALFHSI